VLGFSYKASAKNLQLVILPLFFAAAPHFIVSVGDWDQFYILTFSRHFPRSGFILTVA
jgi:hypothetical protein